MDSEETLRFEKISTPISFSNTIVRLIHISICCVMEIKLYKNIREGVDVW